MPKNFLNSIHGAKELGFKDFIKIIFKEVKNMGYPSGTKCYHCGRYLHGEAISFTDAWGGIGYFCSNACWEASNRENDWDGSQEEERKKQERLQQQRDQEARWAREEQERRNAAHQEEQRKIAIAAGHPAHVLVDGKQANAGVLSTVYISFKYDEFDFNTIQITITNQSLFLTATLLIQVWLQDRFTDEYYLMKQAECSLLSPNVNKQINFPDGVISDPPTARYKFVITVKELTAGGDYVQISRAENYIPYPLYRHSVNVHPSHSLVTLFNGKKGSASKIPSELKLVNAKCTVSSDVKHSRTITLTIERLQNLSDWDTANLRFEICFIPSEHTLFTYTLGDDSLQGWMMAGWDADQLKEGYEFKNICATSDNLRNLDFETDDIILLIRELDSKGNKTLVPYCTPIKLGTFLWEPLKHPNKTPKFTGYPITGATLQEGYDFRDKPKPAPAPAEKPAAPKITPVPAPKAPVLTHTLSVVKGVSVYKGNPTEYKFTKPEYEISDDGKAITVSFSKITNKSDWKTGDIVFDVMFSEKKFTEGKVETIRISSEKLKPLAAGKSLSAPQYTFDFSGKMKGRKEGKYYVAVTMSETTVDGTKKIQSHHFFDKPFDYVKPQKTKAASKPAGNVCANCGAELPEGAGFCIKCGTKVPEFVFCFKCGEKLPADAGFCFKCGTKLK